jgi:hypothetical protein
MAMGLLQHIQHQISAVNDLIRINNDRSTVMKKRWKAPAARSMKRYLSSTRNKAGNMAWSSRN